MRLIKVELDVSTMCYALLVALLALLLLRAVSLISCTIGGGWHYVAAAHFIA